MKKLWFCLLFFVPLVSFAEDFVAGKDYVLLKNTSAEDASTDKVAVVEFFSYGCPWCYRLEESLNKWRSGLSSKVTFSRVPVVYEPGWEVYAKAYYTGAVLGMDSKLSKALFKAIQDDKQKLESVDAMSAFLIKQGVKPELAKSALNHSPTIDAKVKNGMSLMQSYSVFSVPAIVIGGQYRVDLALAKGSPERLFQICDYLIEKRLSGKT